jgi:hypothetical protein
MLGLAKVSMQWRVLRKSKVDDDDDDEEEEESRQWESGIARINAARWCYGSDSK